MKVSLIQLAAAAVIATAAMPAQAQLYIVPNGGIADTAEPETQTAGGPGFPLNLWGYQHDATLYVSTTGIYRFTFLGAGDATDTNVFSVGANSFTAVGIGGTGAGSDPVGSSFDVPLTAGAMVPFSYSNLTTGCTMANGEPVGVDEQCHYLLALADSPGPVPAVDPQLVAYIGWSDRPGINIPVHTGDHDFQDLSVRVELVPEPASLAMLTVGLLGIGMARRRRG